MIDALSDRSHSAFPLLLFLVVHGPNHIDVLTFGKVVEASDKLVFKLQLHPCNFEGSKRNDDDSTPAQSQNSYQ